jgi:hypothetical protein
VLFVVVIGLQSGIAGRWPATRDGRETLSLKFSVAPQGKVGH